jgi:hypothetical protein
METNKVPKSSNKYCCELCNYNTSRNSQIQRHYETDKHKKNQLETNGNNKVPKSSISNNTNFLCETCNKTFISRAGLWKHNKKCNEIDVNNPETNNATAITDKEFITTLIKDNAHVLKDLVIELMKTGTNNTTNNNSHNKTFNLQFFLNDTCKDAMNIMDFVHNLHLKLDDLEKMGELGYVNGISNIIVKNLKDMDITARPIHCTDAKREVLYVKDENKWEKETTDYPKVRKAIKHIAHKNSKLLNDFKQQNPDYNKSDSKVSDHYNKLLIETLGGKGDNDYEKESKIIKNLSKEVLVDK